MKIWEFLGFFDWMGTFQNFRLSFVPNLEICAKFSYVLPNLRIFPKFSSFLFQSTKKILNFPCFVPNFTIFLYVWSKIFHGVVPNLRFLFFGVERVKLRSWEIFVFFCLILPKLRFSHDPPPQRCRLHDLPDLKPNWQSDL